MKIKKIILVLLVFILAINVTAVFSYAEEDLLQVVKDEIQRPEGADKAESIAQMAFSVFQVVASAVVIIYAMILGTKYMTSAPGDRAQIKQHAIIFVVGAILIFGASEILELVISFTEENIK